MRLQDEKAGKYLSVLTLAINKVSKKVAKQELFDNEKDVSEYEESAY